MKLLIALLNFGILLGGSVWADPFMRDPLLGTGEFQWSFRSQYTNSQSKLKTNFDHHQNLTLKSLNPKSSDYIQLKSQGLKDEEKIGTVDYYLRENSLTLYPTYSLGVYSNLSLSFGLQLAERALSLSHRTKFDSKYSQLSRQDLNSSLEPTQGLESSGEGLVPEQAQVVGHYLISRKHSWVLGSRLGLVIPTNTSYDQNSLAPMGSSRGQVDLNQQIYFENSLSPFVNWGLAYQYSLQLENQMSVGSRDKDEKVDPTVIRDSGDIQIIQLMAQTRASRNLNLTGELLQIEKYKDQYRGEGSSATYKQMEKGTSYKVHNLRFGVEYLFDQWSANNYSASLVLQSPANDFMEARIDTTQVDFRVLF